MASGKRRFNHAAVNGGQTVMSPLKFVRQPFMVDARTVQNYRVQIMHMRRILDDVKAVFVCGSIQSSWSKTTAGQPHRETAAVMVAPVFFQHRSMTINRAAELDTTHDQSFLKQPSLFQIANQRCGWLIGQSGPGTNMSRCVASMLLRA